MPLDVERPIVTVNRTIGKILVRLDASHKRQAGLVGPIGIAGLHPLIKIIALRAQHRHHVYRRAAAHNAAGKGIVSAAVEMPLGRKHRDVF